MPRRGPTKCLARINNLKRFDHPNVLATLLFGSPFFEPADALVPADYPRAMERWRVEIEEHRASGMVPWIDTIWSPKNG